MRHMPSILLASILTFTPVAATAQTTRPTVKATVLKADKSLTGRAWKDTSGAYRCRLPNGNAGYVRFGGDSTLLLILAVILIGAGIFIEAPPATTKDTRPPQRTIKGGCVAEVQPATSKRR